MITNADFPLKPEKALGVRQGLGYLLREHRPAVEQFALGCSEGFELNILAEILPRMPVYLWKLEVMQAAVAGAETFLGETLGYVELGNLLAAEGQFWVFDVPVNADADLFGLERDGMIMAVALIGVVGVEDLKPEEAGKGWRSIDSLGTRARDVGIEPVFVIHHDWKEGDTEVPLPVVPRLRFAAPIWSAEPIEADYFHPRLVAALRFLQTEVATVEMARSSQSRAHRRWLARHGRLPDLSQVRVVTMRRSARRSSPGEEPEPVDWSCRWLVGAHWRRQWYPASGEHRPRYIAPYVKGPEDKPLRPPRESIFRVRR